jgi:hypothetical protein
LERAGNRASLMSGNMKDAMKPITLEAMARRVSRLAEKMFDEVGELPQMLWLVDAAGDLGPHTMVVEPPHGAEEKDKQAAFVREHFATHGVTRYASA